MTTNALRAAAVKKGFEKYSMGPKILANIYKNRKVLFGDLNFSTFFLISWAGLKSMWNVGTAFP